MAKKRGRPSDYNQDIADRLCTAIATSSEGLRRLCAKNPLFPSVKTIYRWLVDNTTFRARYAHARELQAQAIFDEILEIADRPKMGTVTKVDSRGRRERRMGDMIDRSRLQVDARKWVLSKLLPRKYGDHLEVDVGEGDPLVALLEEMRARSKEIGPPEGRLAADEQEQVQ